MFAELYKMELILKFECQVITFLVLLFTTQVAGVGNDVDGRSPLPTSQLNRDCKSHWIQASLSAFLQYKIKVEQLLEASAPSTAVSSDIHKALNSLLKKLSFLVGFVNGRKIKSASQELWTQSILRSYLYQASSSVLNNIWAFSIGRQVSIVNLCYQMVAEIRANASDHMQFCSPWLESLGIRRLQSADICLSSGGSVLVNTNLTGVAPRQGGIWIPPSFIPMHCVIIWKPVGETRARAVQTVVNRLKDLQLPQINMTLLTTELQNRQAATRSIIKSSQERPRGQSPTEWVLWKREMFVNHDRDTAKVLDAVFDVLPEAIKQLLKAQCDHYFDHIRRVSIVENTCLNIKIPLATEGFENFCFLSMKAVGGSVDVSVSPRANSPQLDPLVSALPTDPCKVVGSLSTFRKTTLDAVLALFRAVTDSRVSVVMVSAFQAQQDKYKATTASLLKGEFASIKASKTDVEWAQWLIEKFSQLNKESGDVVDKVFDKMSPLLRSTLRVKCVAHKAMVREHLTTQAKCSNLELNLGPDDGNCWLSNRALNERSSLLDAISQ